MNIDEMIEAGLHCPRCKKSRIRAGDLDNSIFASVDCFICIDCGFRWNFAHQTKDMTVDNIKQILDDNFLWVLCTRDLNFIDKKVENINNGEYSTRGNIYCKGCKWHRVGGICIHPSSKYESENNKNYYRKYFDYISCSARNYFNKCGDYTRKPWWMFWRG